jgi:STE24 endopeptidase
MRLERLILYPLLLIGFQLGGGAPVLRRRLTACFGSSIQAVPSPRPWYRRVTLPDFLLILSFVVILDTGLALLYLPFNYYRGFVMGHQFGLSTQTAAGWLADWGKSLLLTLATDGLLWGGFYALLQAAPRRWPIPAGALLLGFGFVYTLITPLLITPLFYTVQPLEDAGLRARIVALTQRAGMPVETVEVIDASSKTTTVNAYFTGFGNDRRIVLYDTLLASYTPDQLEVVLAHEMGHWYYRHVFWGTVGLGVAGWLGLFGLKWLLGRTWQPLGLTGPADVAGLPYLLAVLAVVSILTLPVENAISRTAERQADTYALALSQKPTAFIGLFEQFAGQNLSKVDPPAWEKLIFYTHPPIVERVQMARAHLP